MIGKVIKIIDSTSVFTEFIGRYGVVKDAARDGKWVVEFNARVGGRGSLSHTVNEKDFEVVGQSY